ncbi:hypothetical protein V498_07877 [Pseudogymnoascus sp. VKM F-4517 (FW-2822)]|nr:hypothetical protein V498_07877 [Pseudogymnoascus sp. VKM F-4517 (FW-2822)]
MTLNIRPSTPFFEYRLPSPHPRSLWLAKSATEWKQLYLSRIPSRTPKVMELLASMPNISVAEGFSDTPHSVKLAFHLLGGMIVDHHLFATGFRSATLGGGENTELESIRSRRVELKATIQSFERALIRVVGATDIAPLIVSYLSMRLMVSIENIAILAGKEGEEESRQMYQTMKFWPQTPEAREAIWHAGQILRFLTLVERLTSFQIVIAYQAGLSLFGYSLLTPIRDDAKIYKQQNAIDLPILYINGPPVTQVEAFIHDGSYLPMLQNSCGRIESPAAASLSDGCDIIRTVSVIISDRACKSVGLSPRLVHSLLKLLDDLGAAACTSQNELQRVQEF